MSSLSSPLGFAVDPAFCCNPSLYKACWSWNFSAEPSDLPRFAADLMFSQQTKRLCRFFLFAYRFELAL
jgi:hypothetical protein